MKNPIKIAVTGKIGSGKSTVADILKDLGYYVFESDKEVDKLFNNNNTKKRIEKLFWQIKNLTNKDGSINKTLLGDYVFSKKDELKNLENLIYPLLNKERKKFINSKQMEKILFFDVPLLFEKNVFSEYNFIIYLYVNEKIQRERVLKRKKNE